MSIAGKATFEYGIKHTLGSPENCPGNVKITLSSLSRSSRSISNVITGVFVVLLYNNNFDWIKAINAPYFI